MLLIVASKSHLDQLAEIHLNIVMMNEGRETIKTTRILAELDRTAARLGIIERISIDPIKIVQVHLVEIQVRM